MLTLSIVAALLVGLSANYTDWVDKNQVGDGAEQCRQILQQPPSPGRAAAAANLLGSSNKTVVVGVDCGGSGVAPFWFNLIWLVPLGAVMLYLVTPFVK